MSAAPALRRGWCPSVLEPMQTGDGLLVRIHPRGGAVTAEQARAVADAAQACGNGLIDVSTRGNLQIRGVAEDTHQQLIGRLIAADLVDPRSGSQPLTIVSPLAGIDPSDFIDARGLAEKIECEIGSLAGPPAKTAVVVDGGGALALDGIDADIRLVAVPASDGPRLALGLASADGPVWAGTVTAEAAPAAVRRLLAAFLALRAGGETEAARVRDVTPALRAPLAAAAEAGLPVKPPARAPAVRIGVIDLGGDRVAVIVALPFGRCDAETFTKIAGWSESLGKGEIRVSPWRGIALPGVSRPDARIVVEAARSAGLIVDAAEPRLALAACPGSPACANATTATRDDATRLAEAAASLIRSGVTVHVSGCAKGCAHPKSAPLTLVGDEGAYRVVVNGTAREPSPVRLPIGELLRRLGKVRDAAGLRNAFSEAAP